MTLLISRVLVALAGSPSVCCHSLGHHPCMLALSKVVVAPSSIVRPSIAITTIELRHLLEIQQAFSSKYSIFGLMFLS